MRSLSTLRAGRPRVLPAVVAALTGVTLWAVPSPAATGGPTLPPKVKESGATGGRYQQPSFGATLRPPQSTTRLGFCGGDDWEPEIAADGFGHVYVVWPHFPGDPTCDPASDNPLDVYIQVSSDGGQTFGPPRLVADVPHPSVVDTVVTTNEAGVVFVSFMAYGLDKKTVDVVVARSDDFGQTFTWTAVSGPECVGCDHPWIVSRGDNVYVAYAEGPDHFLSVSTDGGFTWEESLVLKEDNVAFAEGAVVDALGNAWFAWADCKGSCTGKVAVHYRVSRTLAGTDVTEFATVAEGPAGPHCPHRVVCGFAYFGPQNDIAIDAAGNLYMVWQDGQVHDKPKSPPIVQLSRCDAGKDCTKDQNWLDVGRVDDKASFGCAGSQCFALFPRVEGGISGHISAMWMDDRLGTPIDHNNGWNVWYRSSEDGGETWSGPGVRVSEHDPARSESFPNGFLFPYGDYHGIDLVPGSERPVMIWGEGHNYVGGPSAPGHVIYGTLP
jgi:hypothetical protein